MYHEASNDVSKYLENPINAYLIVKRLTTDWKVVENAMSENVGQGKYNTFQNSSCFKSLNIVFL